MSEATSNPDESTPLHGVPHAGVYVEPGSITAFDVDAGCKRTITLASLVEAEDDAGIMAFAQILYLRDILSATATTEAHMRKALDASSGAQVSADQAIDEAVSKVGAMMQSLGANKGGGFSAEDLASAIRGAGEQSA